MKNIVRAVARRCGFEIVHRSEEPVLQSLLGAYNELRLNPADSLRWDHRLSRLASFGHLRSLFRRHAIDLLIDVGANRGQFALEARRAGYEGDIVSFEPLAAHQSLLQQLAARDGRWQIVPCGLGAAATELDLNVFRDDTFSSVLPLDASAGRAFGHLVALDHTERIAVRTLDQVMLERKLESRRSLFLKTDTQGYDAAVLAGAAQTLRSTVVVLTEATVAPLYAGATHLDEINSLLLPLGFARSGLFPIGYAPDTQALIELDCFYCRPHRPK